MGGKKKQRTKWRKLSLDSVEEHQTSSPRPTVQPAQQRQFTAPQRRTPRLVSSGLVAVPVAAVPLVPACASAVETRYENGPDPEAKGCYVNGLWIPASELPRTQWLQLFLLLPRPCLAAPPGARSTHAVGAVSADFESSCRPSQPRRNVGSPSPAAATNVPLVEPVERLLEPGIPPPTDPTSQACGHLQDLMDTSDADDAGSQGDSGHGTPLQQASAGLEELVNRTATRCMEEARPEILLATRSLVLRWAPAYAEQLVNRAMAVARAELRSRGMRADAALGTNGVQPSSCVDGQAGRLASDILAAAVSAGAQIVCELAQQGAPRVEEQHQQQEQQQQRQQPQQEQQQRQQQQQQQRRSSAQRLLDATRDKAHFLADPATSPELRGMLGTGDCSRPSEPRLAEIVVHELDDDLSEAGSEDVELLGHRYESAVARPSGRGESLASELRRCRELSPGDSGVQSQESGDEASVKPATLTGTRRWRTKLMAGLRPGSPLRLCCSIL